jgi:histidine ammonia-lyase
MAAPCLPRKGGVGASGDLVQLAHMALLVIGEGECWHEERRVATPAAYADTGLQPYKLLFRDGLALLNGTSATVSMGVHACRAARQLFEAAITYSCILVEIVDDSREAYALAVHEAKKHHAQLHVARRMQVHLGEGFRSEKPVARAEMQMPYSLRCVPQIIGPMFDALAFAERALLHELNSASDNPVFDPSTGEALHGGNFHGEAVALAMDVLKISVIKCSLLMERQLNFVLNDRINGKLPPFLNLPHRLRRRAKLRRIGPHKVSVQGSQCEERPGPCRL